MFFHTTETFFLVSLICCYSSFACCNSCSCSCCCCFCFCIWIICSSCSYWSFPVFPIAVVSQVVVAIAFYAVGVPFVLAPLLVVVAGVYHIPIIFFHKKSVPSLSLSFSIFISISMSPRQSCSFSTCLPACSLSLSYFLYSAASSIAYSLAFVALSFSCLAAVYGALRSFPIVADEVGALVQECYLQYYMISIQF